MTSEGSHFLLRGELPSAAGGYELLSYFDKIIFSGLEEYIELIFAKKSLNQRY